jgi:transcription-repair coupling factor (superfamily II helicase)
VEQLLRENINIGDIVVHRNYGLGRFIGLETIEQYDFLKIFYANDTKLYVPVEDIEVITRYGSYDENIELDTLGSVKWNTKKQKVHEKISNMAIDLIKIATKRYLSKAPILVPDENEYKEFCEKFEYKETEDQQKAINDVENDLQNGIPSDRLVCGDVGFGKTEIAIRAAFIVASNKMQVAIFCPTTLLTRQHHLIFKKRFENTNIKIGVVSRLTKDNETTKKMVENGEINIIIGTHALLNYKFKNLGLLVVDEEQKFGVKQKEKLKELRDGVHLLTLSATPIPRTLQMAMTGVRDLSIINTPPIERVNIDTNVLKFNKDDFNKAIKNEINRSGKVLIVVPRINDIIRIEEIIRTKND